MPALLFGRRRRYSVDADTQTDIASDARIFLLTFAGGFLFMSVYLA